MTTIGTTASPAPANPLLAVRAHVRARPLVGTTLGLASLTGASLYLRTRDIAVGFWGDEAISIGIASQPLTEIPSILRLDGSPPLYYALLHLWQGAFGTSEPATHALSLLFALLVIPAAFWAGASLFDRRAGWTAATVASFMPYLTHFAQETRMYTLVTLLSLVASACFVHALVHRRRAYLVPFALALAGAMYAHNWALFLGLAFGVAWLALLRAADRGEARKALLRDGLLAFGAVALVYLPWVPTLLFQAAHTGAPWADRPNVGHLISIPERVFGSSTILVLLLSTGAGVATILTRRRQTLQRKALLTIFGIAVGTACIAWLQSQVTPAWATRYLAVAVGPLLLAVGASLAAGGRLSLVGLGLCVLVWIGTGAPEIKSNARDVSERLAVQSGPADLMVVTQPEQMPVLAHYLPDHHNWATLWGRVDEPRVTDWRDGVPRMRASTIASDLQPLLDQVPVGGRVVLVTPMINRDGDWRAPWTSSVRLRSELWQTALRNDPRFRVTAYTPVSPFPRRPNPVKAEIFVRQDRPLGPSSP